METGRRKEWLRRVLAALGVCLAGWALLAVSGRAGMLGWLGEMPANFPVLPLAASGLAIGIFARQRWRLAACLCAGVWFLLLGSTLLPPRGLEIPGRGGATVRMATWNVYLGHLDAADAARWVAAENVDVIVFTEITKPLRDALEAAFAGRFPYFLGTPREGPGGLAVFSRLQVANWDRRGKSTQGAEFDLKWPGGVWCRIFVAHPPAPTSGTNFAQRALCLRGLAEAVNAERRPAVALGDLNASWASGDFQNLCRRAGMLPASRFVPSWPAMFPKPLRIPIDHVLARPEDFGCTAAKSGTNGFGSDHLPVLAELVLQRAEPPRVR